MRKAIICALLVFTAVNGFAQDMADKLTASEELENINYKNNLLDSFSVTGTGIVTAKPDNVFVQLSISSIPGTNMASLGRDLDQKLDFLIRSLCRDFKLKKENFKVSVSGIQMQESTSKIKTASSKYDDEGKLIPEKSYTSSMKKTIVINDLGAKTPQDLLALIDAGVKYGAVAIAANAAGEETATSSITEIGSNKAKMALTKGGSAAKITPDIKDAANQLINYHFNEETLKKLMKQAKDNALKEIREKFSRLKEKMKLNEADFDFNLKEEYNAASTEDGEISIKADISLNYARPKK